MAPPSREARKIWEAIKEESFPGEVTDYLKDEAALDLIQHLLDADIDPEEVKKIFLQALVARADVFIRWRDMRRNYDSPNRSEGDCSLKGSLGLDLRAVQPRRPSLRALLDTLVKGD